MVERHFPGFIFNDMAQGHMTLFNVVEINIEDLMGWDFKTGMDTQASRKITLP